MQLVCLTVFDACGQISIQILAKFKQKICTKMMNASITHPPISILFDWDKQMVVLILQPLNDSRKGETVKWRN